MGPDAVRGSRDGLANAAEVLEAMGSVGGPWAHKLRLRVAELDSKKRPVLELRHRWTRCCRCRRTTSGPTK